MLRDGDLPIDPSTGTVPVPVNTETRQATTRIVNAEIDPADLPLRMDAHAEAQVLGMLMWAGEHAPALVNVGMVSDLLTVRKFATMAHQAIFRAIEALHGSAVSANPTAVHSELVRFGDDRKAGGVSYLDKLTYSVANVTEEKLREHARSIHNVWSLRGMSYYAREVDRISKTAQTGTEALEFARTKLVELSEVIGDSAGGLVSINACAKTIVQQMVDAMNGRKESFRTGLETFDDMTGGFFPNEVNVIAARTSVGKSALATSLSLGVVENNPNAGVLYVSLEMPAVQFVRRMVAAKAGVDSRRIRRGLINGDDMGKIRLSLMDLATKELEFVDSQTQTCASIEAIARNHATSLARKGKRLAAVVIDHIHLVKASDASSKKSREAIVSEISQWTIQLASSLSCAVIALAQINREAEGQKGKPGNVPHLHHLRESGAIEQNANNIIIIHRQRNANGQFVDDQRALLSLAKARDGETAIARLGWNGPTASFYDLPHEERAAFENQ
jgi:replicative DNA helicase